MTEETLFEGWISPKRLSKDFLIQILAGLSSNDDQIVFNLTGFDQDRNPLFSARLATTERRLPQTATWDIQASGFFGKSVAKNLGAFVLSQFDHLLAESKREIPYLPNITRLRDVCNRLLKVPNRLRVAIVASLLISSNQY